MSVRPRRWTGRSRGGRAGNLFFVALVRHGGLALAPFFLFWVALWFLLAAPAARRASVELARRVGRGAGPLRRLSFAARHFFSYGTLLVERLAILSGGVDRFRVEVRGDGPIRAAGAAGRGAVLVSAHFGNWEAMAQSLTEFGAPVVLVMFDGADAAERQAQARLADGRHFDVLFTDGSPGAAAGILAALRRGAIVGMMADRVLAGAGVAVDFLGGRARFPVGPYAVAAAAGAPLFHVFAVRVGRRRYRFEGIPRGVPAGAAQRGAVAFAACAEAFARDLEARVRERPWQWGNFFPFWSAPPTPEAPPPPAPAAAPGSAR